MRTVTTHPMRLMWVLDVAILAIVLIVAGCSAHRDRTIPPVQHPCVQVPANNGTGLPACNGSVPSGVAA